MALSFDPTKDREYTREESHELWTEARKMAKAGDCDFSGWHFPEDPMASDSINGFRAVGFSGRANFNGAKFCGKVDFHNVQFTGPVAFMATIFTERADFCGAYFNSEANFKDAKFKGEAIFVAAKFVRAANFSDTDFIESPSFNNVKFKFAYFKNAKFAKGASFCNAEFQNIAHFANTTLTETIDFKGSVFWQKANFNNVTFSGLTSFMDAIFHTKGDFEYASFTKEAIFLGARFVHEADFRIARFNEKASFTGAKFDGETKFWHVVFNGETNFINTKFNGSVSFFRASFSNQTDFSYMVAEGACFQESMLQKCNLHEADLSNADFRDVIQQGRRKKGDTESGKWRSWLPARWRDYGIGWLVRTMKFGRPFPFVLDDTKIQGARFASNSADPWTVLRRTYSGPMLAFHLLLLVGFLIPLVSRTVFWVTVGRVQAAASESEDYQNFKQDAKETKDNIQNIYQNVSSINAKVNGLKERFYASEDEPPKTKSLEETEKPKPEDKPSVVSQPPPKKEERLVLSLLVHWDKG